MTNSYADRMAQMRGLAPASSAAPTAATGVAAALAHIDAAIQIHTGHMNGTVVNNKVTEGVEMRHLQAAARALTAMK